MSGWRRHTGRIAHLAMENVDTDQLIPARFMSAPRSAGYGSFLLHDVPEAAPQLTGASILVAGRNFGCGSSREAAVYALVDFGIRAVVAPSFGDIFAANAVNNGLLPARIDTDFLERLADAKGTAEIDLEACEIQVEGRTVPFFLDPAWQQKLINGWDDIDLTDQHQPAIRSFRKAYRDQAPWAWPGREEDA